MTAAKQIFFCGLVIASIFFFASIHLVDAESVVHSAYTPTIFTHRGGNTNPGAVCNPASRPHVDVSYNVRAIDVATGASVCNSTIPTGTQIRFEFQEHVSSDIYWFTTGYNWDSPYGNWVADAKPEPGPAFCADGAGTSLSVNPPVKSLSGISSLASCTIPDANGTQTCTASSQGSYTAAFNFGETYGYFYQAHYANQCNAGVDRSGFEPLLTSPNYYYADQGGGTGWKHICPTSVPAKHVVTQQAILCPFTVVNVTGGPPTDPTLSGIAVNGSAQCTVGTPYTINITATDPDGDDLRYMIDWDSNGIVDQILPTTGYIASGTTLSASRTYATNGVKRVKVMAQDDRGLTSSWSTFTANCTTPDSPEVVFDSGDDADLGGGGGAGATTLALSIKAIPSLVRRGESTAIHWSASNVVSCTVSGTNGDGADSATNVSSPWRGALSPGTEGVPTSNIVVQTTYTLSCLDASEAVLTKSATVNVLPRWEEL